MAMGKRRVERPGKLWIATTDIARGPGCAFYRGLNRVLDEAGFDDHTQDVCREFYASGRGRPSMPPESYFRLLMVGYFEGIPSERGIAWQLGDSLSLKEFVGLGPTDRGWVSMGIENATLLSIENATLSGSRFAVRSQPDSRLRRCVRAVATVMVEEPVVDS